MAIKISILCCLFVILHYARAQARVEFNFSPPRKWSTIKEYKNRGVWKSTDNSEMVTIHKQMLDQKHMQYLNHFISKDTKSIEQSRQHVFKKIGITAWIIDEINSRQVGDHWQISMLGSYTNHRDKKVRFLENSYYVPGVEMIKFLYTTTSNQPISNLKAEQLIGRYAIWYTSN
jgi:hypothetical protein